jgi:hypothetical protein
MVHEIEIEVKESKDKKKTQKRKGRPPKKELNIIKKQPKHATTSTMPREEI